MKLWRYQSELAWRSIRRDARLSMVMVLSLGLAGALWGFGTAHYLRVHGPRDTFRAAVHHVELPHDEGAVRDLIGSGIDNVAYVPRIYATAPEVQQLASSGLPTRSVTTFHSVVWVDPPDATPPAPRVVRYVDPDFFALFERPFRWGGPYQPGDEMRALPRIVIGHGLNQSLFDGDNSVGQKVRMEGRDFEIAGVIDGFAPYLQEWDIAATGFDEDAVYLPVAFWQRLRTVPTPLLLQSSGPVAFDDLITSDAVFVNFWIELPTADHVQRYRRHLDAEFGDRYTLRSLPEFQAAFPSLPTAVTFYFGLGWFLILGGGFNLVRLLLAKNLARGPELGIHRALGASRRQIFRRQLLEGAHVSAFAALIAFFAVMPLMHIYNRLVHETDVPLAMTPLLGASIIGMTFLIGLLGAAYPAWRSGRVAPTLYLGRA